MRGIVSQQKENHKPMSSQATGHPAIIVWPLHTLVLEYQDEAPTVQERNRGCAQRFLNI